MPLIRQKLRCALVGSALLAGLPFSLPALSQAQSPASPRPPERALTPAYAAVSNMTSAELAKLCDSDGPDKPGSVSMTPCSSYILGAADQLSFSRTFCLNSSAYSTRVIAEVKRYLRANPRRGEVPPVSIIREALSRAFPC